MKVTHSRSPSGTPSNVASGDYSTGSENPTLPPTPASPTTTGSKKFLLVDDNPINLKILAAYMTKLGQDFATAINGQEAVDAYRAAPGSFKCIFMDISMPVMDGFEATRCIRDFEREKALDLTVILALSGIASDSAQQEAHASGINSLLAKPAKLKVLREILLSLHLLEP